MAPKKSHYLNKLHKPLAKISRIPYINYGGCGFVARAVYLHLQSLGHSPKIYYLDDNPTIYPTEAPGHIVIKWGRHYIHADGTYTRFSDLDFPHYIEVTFNQLNHCLQNTSSWNPRFDRRRVRTIHRIFNLASTKGHT